MLWLTLAVIAGVVLLIRCGHVVLAFGLRFGVALISMTAGMMVFRSLVVALLGSVADRPWIAPIMAGTVMILLVSSAATWTSRRAQTNLSDGEAVVLDLARGALVAIAFMAVLAAAGSSALGEVPAIRWPWLMSLAALFAALDTCFPSLTPHAARWLS